MTFELPPLLGVVLGVASYGQVPVDRSGRGIGERQSSTWSLFR